MIILPELTLSGYVFTVTWKSQGDLGSPGHCCQHKYLPPIHEWVMCLFSEPFIILPHPPEAVKFDGRLADFFLSSPVYH